MLSFLWLSYRIILYNYFLLSFHQVVNMINTTASDILPTFLFDCMLENSKNLIAIFPSHNFCFFNLSRSNRQTIFCRGRNFGPSFSVCRAFCRWTKTRQIATFTNKYGATHRAMWPAASRAARTKKSEICFKFLQRLWIEWDSILRSFSLSQLVQCKLYLP